MRRLVEASDKTEAEHGDYALHKMGSPQAQQAQKLRYKMIDLGRKSSYLCVSRTWGS